MRRLLSIVLLSAAAAWAQNPATITVATTVSATAGTGATAIACIFTDQAGPIVSCPGMPAGYTLVIPAPQAPAGSISGIVASTALANSITWIFTPGSAAGTWNYSITANVTIKTGVF